MLCLTTERATLSRVLADDGYLIERLRTGDDTAFEELVDHRARDAPQGLIEAVLTSKSRRSKS